MELYLVQHAEAKSEREDPARPLSERGRQELERVGRAAGRLGIELQSISHSGKLRALQTAEILAEHLKPVHGIGELSGLAPKDDPRMLKPAIESFEGAQMLVGHLPHLSRLASLLLVDDPERELIAFRMGAIVCLAREAATPWRLRWILTPELAYG